MLPSHLFSMFCRIVACLGDCGQSRCPSVWAALPHVPSHIGGVVLPTSKKVRKGWEFSVPLVEKAGLRKLKLLFFFFFAGGYRFQRHFHQKRFVSRRMEFLVATRRRWQGWSIR